MPRGYSIQTLPNGKAVLHPLRLKLRELILDGKLIHEDTGEWFTYPEMALELNPEGCLAHSTVCQWMWKDFPEVAEQKMCRFVTLQREDCENKDEYNN